VFSLLRLTVFADAYGVSEKIARAFVEHPNWLQSEAALREARKAATFAVYAEVDDLDEVTAIVDKLFSDLREELQDYVIAHELLHFHAPNHGKLWKSLMRAHLGAYEELEDELRGIAQREKHRRRAPVGA
jgi:hypothetical protein